ncbi:MAG: hypothetical protein U0694_11830 [Anaerolineae bacterium]
MFNPPATHPVYKRILLAENLPVPPFANAAETIASLLVLPIMLFTGAICGIGWAVNISCVLAEEQRHHTYDLLGLTPHGTLGLCWFAAAACLHRHRGFSNISSRNAMLGRIAILGIFSLAFVPTLTNQQSENVTIYLMYILALLGTILFDPQSIVMSLLIGMLLPNTRFSRAEPAVAAIVICLSLQILPYLAAAFVMWVVLPGLFSWLGIDGFIAGISVPLLGLTGFVLLREFLIRRLWTELLLHMNADRNEFNAVLQLKA